MMTEHEYQIREAQEFRRQLSEPGKDSLQERREARADFLEAMRERPDVVGERVGWLFAGNYGYGSMVAAKQVLAHKRMNRAAWLVQTIAALEWRCPQREAAAAWKQLSPSEKKALDTAVQREIREAERGES